MEAETKLGIIHWAERANNAETMALVLQRALELMYADMGRVKPRLSKEAYVDEALQTLVKELKFRTHPGLKATSG